MVNLKMCDLFIFTGQIDFFTVLTLYKIVLQLLDHIIGLGDLCVESSKIDEPFPKLN